MRAEEWKTIKGDNVFLRAEVKRLERERDALKAGLEHQILVLVSRMEVLEGEKSNLEYEVSERKANAISLRAELDRANMLLVEAEESIGHLSVCGRALGCHGHHKANELRSRLIGGGYISDITASGLPWHPKYSPTTAAPAEQVCVWPMGPVGWYVRCDTTEVSPEYVSNDDRCIVCGRPIQLATEQNVCVYRRANTPNEIYESACGIMAEKVIVGAKCPEPNCGKPIQLAEGK